MAAEDLAIRYSVDKEKAKIAGILHDITKEWSKEKHFRFAKEYDIKFSDYELASKKLLHALTGSYYLKYILKIKDHEIINAVRFHSTARSDMSLLEKIIYISDFISEERRFEGVEELRELSRENLESTMICGLAYSLHELVSEKRIIHPNTFKAYNEAIFNKVKIQNIKI
jgi:nicotinate-nucleotide adenylyltransferase